jgi:Secretion system C-terminal sorting domain
MRFISLLLLISFLGITLRGQIPQITWGHSYSISTDDSDEEVRRVIRGVDSRICVLGEMGTQAEIEIGTGTEYLFSAGSNNAMLIQYNSDSNDLAFNYGAGLFDAVCLNTSFYAAGIFTGETNFDLSNSTPVYNVPISGLSGAFISHHSNLGGIFWSDVMTGSIRRIVSTPTGIIGLGTCSDCAYEDINGIQILNTEGSNDCVFYLIDEGTGEVLKTKIIGSLGNDISSDGDYSPLEDEFTATGRSLGSSDYQWEGAVPMVVDHDGPAAFAVSYNDNYEFISLLIITNNEINQNDNCEFSAVSYDDSGNLYLSGIIEQGNYTLKLNDHEEDFIVSNPMELVMIKLSLDKELEWIRRMPVGDFSRVNRIDIDHNGFINACGYYNTSISFEGTNISYTDGGDYSGFIARWTPEGELVWAHTIYDSAGDNEIKDICITPQNYMYIGGYFTSFSTDFDFTEGQYDLGITNGEDAFLAKYTIANPTADVFIEQGWQTTEVSEAGTEDAIYIRLSHIPSAAVQVTVTPDTQLDLGNGAGNSITLTFGADSTAIQQQTINVAAFNDIVVEGPHTGLISFSINSNDAAFDALTEDAITATITDNDFISVEENAALKFSVSPNPVIDELNISYNQFQNNTNLSIYDEVGQLVLSTKANGAQQKINTSSLSSGRYSLVLMEGDSKSVMSFVKE